ncbi:hypothetical protein X746_25850 [Mesorhizobium sp. LNJC380A00]|nr:hypothetical protein X746_25850 [Mesorhizobium sp. LNJC380A00]ESZ54525.1 hypothetical protein X728_31315 [Mesorhizobium sp. L103C120A0]
MNDVRTQFGHQFTDRADSTPFCTAAAKAVEPESAMGNAMG